MRTSSGFRMASKCSQTSAPPYFVPYALASTMPVRASSDAPNHRKSINVSSIFDGSGRHDRSRQPGAPEIGHDRMVGSAFEVGSALRTAGSVGIQARTTSTCVGILKQAQTDIIINRHHESGKLGLFEKKRRSTEHGKTFWTCVGACHMARDVWCCREEM